MSVAQFGQHLCENLEQLLVVELTFRAYIIYIIYILPVEPILMLFIVKEAIMLVDDMPQGFEVALWGVIVLFVVNTRDAQTQVEEHQ